MELERGSGSLERLDQEPGRFGRREAGSQHDRGNGLLRRLAGVTGVDFGSAVFAVRLEFTHCCHHSPRFSAPVPSLP